MPKPGAAHPADPAFFSRPPLRSGPKRYNWSAERRVWFNARDDGLLQDLLEQELSTIAGRKVTLDFGHL